MPEALFGFLVVVFVIWLIRTASRQSYDSPAFRFSEIEPDPNWQHLRNIRTKIRGVTYRNPDGTRRQNIIRARCHAGDALFLVREPKNPVDPNAIQVKRIICRQGKQQLGEQLGYVSRELAEDLAPRLDGGLAMFAKLTEVTGDLTGQQRRSVGVNIEIQEYKSVHAVSKLLGHARLSTTERYTHISPARMLAAYNAAHPHAPHYEPRGAEFPGLPNEPFKR